ncbi:MAG TPA: alcohol dehydrogenase, partial [Clostridiaceae bacterium]|nr:alcohol dehydrogenase [Clostridiaceae bacterium]
RDLGFTKADLDKITELVFTTPSLDLLLSMAPVDATKEVVKEIYTNAF